LLTKQYIFKSANAIQPGRNSKAMRAALTFDTIMIIITYR